jgi:hypothetical protein
MATQPLPDHADVDRLKAIAKHLRDWVRTGEPGALALVHEHHPRLGDLAAGDERARSFRLADAQLTIARRHGFASWPKLQTHLRVVADLTRSPHAQPVGEPLATDADRADELLRLACLTDGADDRSRPVRARALLDAEPALARTSLHAMAASGLAVAAGELLAADPEAVDRVGGPFRWPPLLYATYSRLPGADTTDVVVVLLGAGADPNAGFLWDGLVPPFTALTGALGGGEGGQPPHPRALDVAARLLVAGADANDGQAVYNRGLGDVARDDTDWLELLLAHGFGQGDGGPWARLLGPALPTPRELLGEAFQHAVEAGLVRRVRLLLAHGADPGGRGLHPVFRGRTAYEGAVLHGHTEIARLLEAAGADTSVVVDDDRFVGACLAGDADAVAELRAHDTTRLDRVLAARPDLVARAVELGRPAAVTLLVGLGFDVDARDRATALHEAAYRGDDDMVRLLLELGADPTIEDAEHHSTPRGWAEFAGHASTAALLPPHAAPG